MKRLWAALALCAVLAVLCVLPLRSVTRFCNTLDARLEDCVRQAQNGDTEAAAQTASDAMTDWNRWQPGANTYLRHAELDPAKESMAEMMACAEAGNWADFVVACRKSQTLVRHLAESERPDWGNVL